MATDLHYLVAMNQSIARIAQYCKAGRSQFEESLLHQHAVLWNLQLLAASARRVSESLRVNHSEMPWDRICSLCKDVIGNPWDVDPHRVWDCVHEELPAVRERIRDIVVERQRK